jgi:hypothetical protein
MDECYFVALELEENCKKGELFSTILLILVILVNLSMTRKDLNIVENFNIWQAQGRGHLIGASQEYLCI